MAERRTLTDAVGDAWTAEETSFIKGGNLKDPQGEGEKTAMPHTARAGRERVTITVRVKPDVAAALIRVTAERKIKHIEPYTQQDIIGDALEKWLSEAGFWSEH